MKVSVITIAKNNENYIEDCITSVNNQNYTDIEHVIVDGASTDRTLSIIKKIAHRCPKIISEPDTGIYNAWNKAIKMATGDYICFCNSDDLLPNNFIDQAMKCVEQNQNSIIFGNVAMIEGHSLNTSKFELGLFDENKLYRGFGFRTTSVFIPRNFFKEIGLFDESFRIAGDTDWLLRAYINKIKFIHSDHFLYMDIGGISNKCEFLAYKEYFKSYIKNIGFDLKAFVVFCKKFVKRFIG